MLNRGAARLTADGRNPALSMPDYEVFGGIPISRSFRYCRVLSKSSGRILARGHFWFILCLYHHTGLKSPLRRITQNPKP